MINPISIVPKFVSVNGIKIAYSENGNHTSPAILFIHGLAENMQTWAKNIPRLKDKFYCIAIDLPGHGLSEAGDYTYTPYFYADTIAAFIKHLKLDNVTLAGHSLGGQISVIMSIAHPTLIKNLVLVSPAGFETFTDPDKRWIKDQANTYGAGFQGFDFLKMWPVYNSPSNDVYKASISGMLAQPVFEHLQLISQPVLVIFGVEDALIPNQFLHPSSTIKSIAENGTAQIPNAKLVLVKHGGHFVNVEKAREVNVEIEKFLI